MSDKLTNTDANQKVDVFIGELDKLTSAEERLHKMLQFMQKELSHGQLKPLNRFWKMRQYCLEQFKDNLYLSKRAQFWKVYQDLVAEIIRMKGLLDEKVASDKQEIENVLSKMSIDLENFDELISKVQPIEMPAGTAISEEHKKFYEHSQKEIEVFSSYAKQLNALKAELIHLEIPYGQKHQILKQVHSLGDQVFPKKRDLLGKISQTFIEDVQKFLNQYIFSKKGNIPFFELKEKIKAYQSLAKILTLNVSSFSQSREKLSQAWDEVRRIEKEHKKQKDQQKAICAENESIISQEIDKLTQAPSSSSEIGNKADKISEKIKSLDLHKTQRRKLKEKLSKVAPNTTSEVTTPIEEQSEEFATNLDKLESQKESLECDFIIENTQQMQEELDQARLPDNSRSKIQRRLSELKQGVMKRIVQQLENKSFNDLEPLIQLYKKSVREDLESFKRALNTSNQSIEKAMLYNELLTQSKQALAELDEKIKTATNSNV